MTEWQALLLGIIQGLTEFFPVSSSAHLKAAKLFFGLETESPLFDLFCHSGTLIALVIYLRHDIRQLFTKERRRLTLFFLALVPLVPSYFLLKPLRDFASAPQFLGLCVFATSLILFMGEKIRFKTPSSQRKSAMMIGACQAVALIPGISRSASTISAGRVLGFTPFEAVRFSFLLAIPTILGGMFLETLKVSGPFDLSHCMIGFFSSLVMGLVTVSLAIKRLEQGRLKPFAWYCLFAAVVITIIANGI
jgi:undecaprenyl-diphosphatase